MQHCQKIMSKLELKSITRIAYFGQIIFVAIAIALLIGILFLDTIFNSRLLHWISAFAISFVICFICFLFIGEARQREIILDDSGIIVKYFFRKQRKIPFEDIISHSTKRIHLKSELVNINDGFKETIFELRDKTSISISQDKFENYEKLVLAIIENLNNKSQDVA